METQFCHTWMYHKELAPEGKLITTKGEFDALSNDWKETPAAFDQKSDETTEKPATAKTKEVKKIEPAKKAE